MSSRSPVRSASTRFARRLLGLARPSAPATSAGNEPIFEPLEVRRLLSASDPLFLDTFDVSAPSYDINFEIASRQSGAMAPLTYGGYGSNGQDWQTQVGSSLSPGGLLLAAKNGTPQWIAPTSPTAGLAPDPGPGGTAVVEFDVNPVVAAPGYNATQSAWAGVKIGSRGVGKWVNNSDGFGLLLRGEGRRDFKAFDGSTTAATGQYTADAADRYHHLKLTITSTDPQGRPFDGSPVVIRAFDDGSATPFLTHTRTAGFTDNYITLSGESEGADGNHVTLHGFDNFRVYGEPSATAPAVPAAPTGLAVTATSTSELALTWSDNAAGEAGYEVERSINGTDGWTRVAVLAADAESHADAALPAGAERFYRVRAVGQAAGTFSDWSTVASGTTTATGTGDPGTGDPGTGDPGTGGGGTGGGGTDGTVTGFGSDFEGLGDRSVFSPATAANPEHDLSIWGVIGRFENETVTMRGSDLAPHSHLTIGWDLLIGMAETAAYYDDSYYPMPERSFTVKVDGQQVYKATWTDGGYGGSGSGYVPLDDAIGFDFTEEGPDGSQPTIGQAGSRSITVPHTGSSASVTFEGKGFHEIESTDPTYPTISDDADWGWALDAAGAGTSCNPVSLSAQQMSVLEQKLYAAIGEASLSAADEDSPLDVGFAEEAIGTKGPRLGANLLENQAGAAWDLGVEVMTAPLMALAGNMGGLIGTLVQGAETFEELEPHVQQQIRELLNRDYFFVSAHVVSPLDDRYSATLEAFVNRCNGRISGRIQGYTAEVIDRNGRFPADADRQIFYETTFSGTVEFGEDDNPGDTTVDLL